MNSYWIWKIHYWSKTRNFSNSSITLLMLIRVILKVLYSHEWSTNNFWKYISFFFNILYNKKVKQSRHVCTTNTLCLLIKNEGASFASQIWIFSINFFLKRHTHNDSKYTRKTPRIKSEDVVNARTRVRLSARNEKLRSGGEGEKTEQLHGYVWFLVCIAVRRPGRKAFREFFQLGKPLGCSSKLPVALYSIRFFISVIAVLNNCISMPPYHPPVSEPLPDSFARNIRNRPDPWALSTGCFALRDVSRCFFHRTEDPVTRDF